MHVYAEELNAATHANTWLSRRRYRPVQWQRSVQWKTYVAHGEPWFGFRCVRELEGSPPEILMLPLVGHTYGHCGVARLMEVDRRARLLNQDRLRDPSDEHGDILRIVCSHDAVEFEMACEATIAREPKPAPFFVPPRAVVDA